MRCIKLAIAGEMLVFTSFGDCFHLKKRQMHLRNVLVVQGSGVGVLEHGAYPAAPVTMQFLPARRPWELLIVKMALLKGLERIGEMWPWKGWS